jgi:acetyl-CoA synthetase
VASDRETRTRRVLVAGRLGLDRGLMDALLPSLYFGRPSSPATAASAPTRAFALMQEHGVTHTFLFPTALKAMMKAFPEPRGSSA